MLFKIKFKEAIDFHKVLEMVPTIEQTTHYWIGVTRGLTYNLYEQMDRIIASWSDAILINLGEEEEIISKALSERGVIYFPVDVEDNLSEVLRG